jgi:tripartite-type tricarboxylate transporter receptor subunit TctC
MRKLRLLVAAVLFAALNVVAPASAQSPARTVRLIVPWPAGGDTDIVFRSIAPLLQKHLGQPVVVANITGASGTLGAREAKDAEADGYTVYGMHDYIHIVYYSGLTNIRYQDFEPVCLTAATPSVLTASARTPWKDWEEFLTDAKKRPGEITVGATPGTNSQIFPALVELKVGIRFRYVTFEGSAPRWAATADGKIDLTNANPALKDKVAAGQLKFLAIAADQRDSEIPSVPTLRELGFDIVHEVARGLVVPKGTPAPVRAKLVEACRKATAEPAFKEAMRVQGTRVAFLDDQGYAALLSKLDGETKAIMLRLGLLKN